MIFRDKETIIATVKSDVEMNQIFHGDLAKRFAWVEGVKVGNGDTAIIGHSRITNDYFQTSNWVKKTSK